MDRDAESNDAALIRHATIMVATLLAYLMRVELRVGNAVLWILGLAAALNFVAFALRAHPVMSRVLNQLSPFFGVAAWAALVHLTRGVYSPFIAGFWIEIIISAMSLHMRATVLVTAAAVAALWAQQALLGIAGAVTTLALETAFLVAMGGLTLLLTRLWVRAHRSASERSAELAGRLRSLEENLSSVREVGRVGENVARFAHGLKNAVHSLRGFLTLLEPTFAEHGRTPAALKGLGRAVDRLEELARSTLAPVGAPPSERKPVCRGEQAYSALEWAISEVSVSFPEIRWVKYLELPAPGLRIAPDAWRETLLTLLRNAAEAMKGKGEIVVEARWIEGAFEVKVRDQGCGLAPDWSRAFAPGRSTKPEGSGFGLYLARRLVEAEGGHIVAEAAAGGGTVITVSLPVRDGLAP